MTAVLLPPLAEQKQIVSEVERLLSIANSMEQTIEQSLKQSERLRQSILKQAFSGQLVPQDPNDEPAAQLLARIREEREKRAAAPSKKIESRAQCKTGAAQGRALKKAVRKSSKERARLFE